MQFNSGNDSIVADVRYWTGANATNYSLANITRNANRAIERVWALIMRFDTNWEWDDPNHTNEDDEYDLPLAIGDLEAGEDNISLSLTHLKIQRVRIKDPDGNWKTLKAVSRRSQTDAELNATGTPETYDKVGASIFFAPIPDYDSEDGVEIQHQRLGEYFAESGADGLEPGYAPQFHRLISLYTALDYIDLPEKRAKKIRDLIGRPPSAGDDGSGLEKDLAEFYSDRDRDQEPAMSVAQTLERF